MTSGTRILATVLAACCAAPACVACTVLVVNRDGEVLFANNEDFNQPGYYWVTGGPDGKLGRINFGFADGRTQGSLNEAGLAFDGMALAEVPWAPDPAKGTPRGPMDRVMDSCRTVREALDYLGRHNCRFLADSQVLIADATGDAALVGWSPEGRVASAGVSSEGATGEEMTAGMNVTRMRGDRLVGTNHRQSRSGYRCPRHVRANQVLDSLIEYGPRSLARVLDAVHQEGPGGYTTYSTVYDLKRRRVTVYNLADFDTPLVLDLASEIARANATKPGLGTRVTRLLTFGRLGSKPAATPLRDRFPDSRSEDELTSRPQRTEFGTTIALPAAHLDRCVGTYHAADDPTARFRIDRDGDRLVVNNPAQPEPATLAPESPTYFRIQPDRGAVSFQLPADTNAPATGLVLHKQIDLVAVRATD